MSLLSEALSTTLAVPDASGARPAGPFRVRLGFPSRSVGRGRPRSWRRPSGSPSRPDVEPAPGAGIGFTSTTLLPVEAAPPALGSHPASGWAPEAGTWPGVRASD